MIEKLTKCKFKYTFRSYQQRALNEVMEHLKDKKINIVAAPGAGKTILALSLMIKIGEPTLIVAPTILLRQQWLDRLKNDFLGFDEIKDFISEDIYNPNLITITTYQSIYSVYKGKSEKSQSIDLLMILKDLKIRTIILDEAHHLKLSWLEATKSMIEKLEDTITVSLTATPPYDIDKNLWNKYISLCGDIDAEISVPELVKTKDLAPHQDYVFFNYLSEKEIEEIHSYNKNVYEFFCKYSVSSELITAISMHDGIVDLESKLDYFIENFEYYDAMISFLLFNKVEIPSVKYFNYKYGYTEFNIYKMQVLLTYCLYNDRKSYSSFNGLFREITKELNNIGAIYERKVNLVYANSVIKAITQNAGKMDSVKTILEIEKNNLSDKLKAVIITENIYKELLNEAEGYDTKYIGVIPLFRYLISKTLLKYIVLTGEIIIIPTEYIENLINIAMQFGVLKENINIDELSLNFNYCKINFEGNAVKNRVLIITKLFEESNIDVLIGSNALIGEGWDAPFINTLIMATSISAYVSANQIRGRAIRKYKNDPEKFANIWHLVCVEKDINNVFKYGIDYENLIKRFEAFEGIDIYGTNIHYGIGRLGIPAISEIRINSLEDLNNRFIQYCVKRKETYEDWFVALKKYKPIRKNQIINIDGIECINEINMGEIEDDILINVKQKELISRNIADIECSAVVFEMYNIAIWFAKKLDFISPQFSLKCRKFFQQKLKISTKDELLDKFIKAIYQTLIFIGKVDKKSRLVIRKIDGKLEYFLENSSFRENEILKVSVNEMMSKVDDERYVLKIKDVYFPVPRVIGEIKENVIYLNRCLGNCARIIYLRSKEGKRELFNIKLLQNNIVKSIDKKEENLSDMNIEDNMLNIEVMDKYLKNN